MGNKAIVVEDGIIECEHGGKVILKSTIKNHVIGGKKPLYAHDLLNADISGCPNPDPNGGPCTKVVSINSSITEPNVVNAGKPYLLRTDGCQTDKGVNVLLKDPGQTNNIINPKPGSNASPLSNTSLEDTKPDKKEQLKKEKYRIYPLRQSNKNLKALRGLRDFQLLKNYFHVNNYTHDLVVTMRDAYLYMIVDDSTVEEFQVINRGDFANPRIFQVHFKDKEGVLRKYLPVYKEDAKVELVYSNMQLSDKEAKAFAFKESVLPITNKSCVSHPNIYAKQTTLNKKEFKKNKLLTKQEAQKLNKPYLNVVSVLQDPIGEVEDLYNEYEFSYHRYYSLNKGIVDTIRAKNQYAYSVTDMLDYLTISTEEQEKFDMQTKELKETYKEMVKLLEAEMIPVIESKMDGNDLAPVINYKVANDYYEELRFLDREFFDGTYSFSLELSKGRYTFTSNRHIGKRLKCSNTEYHLSNNASKTLAFVTFSIYFAKENQDKLPAALKSLCEKFYYQIKAATPLPQINKQTREDLAEELEYQHAYQDIFSGKDALLDEFEELDIFAKEIAFDPKEANAKLKPKKEYGFSSLKTTDLLEEIRFDKELDTPKSIATKIAKALQKSEFKEIMQTYQTILKSNKDTLYHNCNILMNMLTMLFAPRALLDTETQMLSLFNTSNKVLQETLILLIKQMDTLEEEEAIKLHQEDIKEHYLKALYALIAQAMLEKPNQKLKARQQPSKLQQLLNPPSTNDKGREANVKAFLKTFQTSTPQQSIQTEKLLDNNFDKKVAIKTESEELYERLKQINSVSSYLDKFDDTMEQVSEEKNADGRGSSKFKPENILKSLAYKTLLSSIKTLSFLLTVARMQEYVEGKEKLKINNIIGFADDTLSASRYLAELAHKAKSLPKSLEHVIGLEKIVSASSMKVIARFGLVGAMANAVNELHVIDTNTNEEYFIAVGVKNAIYATLLFTPALFALGTIALSEFVWYFIKDSIKNSQIELYLYKSLLFNTGEHNISRTFNHIESKNPYMASIMLESFQTTQKDLPDGFQNAKELREFLAHTQSTDPALCEIAMKNELSLLKAALYGYSVEKEESFGVTRMHAAGITINLHANTIRLSSAFDKKVEGVFLVHNGVYATLPTAKSYDLAGIIAQTSNEFEKVAQESGLYQASVRERQLWMQSPAQGDMIKEMLEDVALIIKTEDTVLKYTIRYETSFKEMNNYATIQTIQATSLSQEDYENIQEKN